MQLHLWTIMKTAKYYIYQTLLSLTMQNMNFC